MPFTDGELNKVIDSIMHPIARDNPWSWALGGVLHGMVEQDPATTTKSRALQRAKNNSARTTKPEEERKKSNKNLRQLLTFESEF